MSDEVKKRKAYRDEIFYCDCFCYDWLFIDLQLRFEDEGRVLFGADE